ncbi:MAG: hypothetical protein COA52_09665 [Hyphomicrobiales bacterium]|nr:MAG: hypothetical protein COA52_09665 [Hyphomicrobiales bacterium]
MGFSSSKNKSSTKQEDNRAAAQDNGIAISHAGDVTIDMIPEDLLELVQNTTTGAFELVTQSLGAVGDSQDALKEIAENTQPNSIVVPLLMAGVAAAYVWRL